jgi:hypothetical protein
MISATELEALLEENEGLRVEIRKLRGKRPADLCWPCELKRRFLALISGLYVEVWWAFWFQNGAGAWIKQSFPEFDHIVVGRAVGGLLVFGPLVVVYARWHFLIFKRNEAWKHWPLYKAYEAYRDARKNRKNRR